jgi:hypothetical protein
MGRGSALFRDPAAGAEELGRLPGEIPPAGSLGSSQVDDFDKVVEAAKVLAVCRYEAAFPMGH